MHSKEEQYEDAYDPHRRRGIDRRHLVRRRATNTAPKSGAMSSSSSMGAQQQATGAGQFCIESTPGGALNCKYASLADCQKDAKGRPEMFADPNSGTTGSKQ